VARAGEPDESGGEVELGVGDRGEARRGHLLDEAVQPLEHGGRVVPGSETARVALRSWTHRRAAPRPRPTTSPTTTLSTPSPAR
jgi:hypothetical protein